MSRTKALPQNDHATEVSATAAALRLGMTRERVIRRIQTRDLAGRLDQRFGWVVSIASVEAYGEHSGTLAPQAAASA